MSVSLTRHIRVQQDDFDLAAEYRELANGGSGACVLFVGLTRDYSEHGDVAALELEHYPGMVEESLDAVVDDASQRWPLERVCIVHRVGRLQPGDTVLVHALTAEGAEALRQGEMDRRVSALEPDP